MAVPKNNRRARNISHFFVFHLSACQATIYRARNIIAGEKKTGRVMSLFSTVRKLGIRNSEFGMGPKMRKPDVR
jgi:hypothetical protein